MNGAIFFSSKYGSTAEYANWIGAATGLPVIDVDNDDAAPSAFDFLVIGSPVYYYKLRNREWIEKHLASLLDRPVILFTVSGAPAGEKLDGWIADCLPREFVARAEHVALRGRQVPAQLVWWERQLLKFAASRNPDPIARKEELEGFDYMDKTSIEPIVRKIRAYQAQA